MATMVEQCAEEGFTALARRPSGSFRSSQEMSELAGRGDKHFMHEQAARAPGTLPPPRDAAAISRARAESEGSLLRRIPHELAVLEFAKGQFGVARRVRLPAGGDGDGRFVALASGDDAAEYAALWQPPETSAAGAVIGLQTHGSTAEARWTVSTTRFAGRLRPTLV